MALLTEVNIERIEKLLEILKNLPEADQTAFDNYKAESRKVNKNIDPWDCFEDFLLKRGVV